MRRLVLLVTASAFLGTLPMPALGQESVLAKADQDRVICAPLRNKSGTLASGELCQTGREWEVALAKARPKHTDWAVTGQRNATLSNPQSFGTGFKQFFNPGRQ
ncbi:MAG: hypothetical protein V4610_23340 [Pseudomonadota bacterium]|jgi:hypothetical protein